jgi:hypothetical protein
VILKQPPLLVIMRALVAFVIFNVNFLLQHRSKVDWLSNSSIFLKSKSSDFLDLRAKTILGLCSSSISTSVWKWLVPSEEDIDKLVSLFSLHFWSALTDLLSFLLLFSKDLRVLERDLIDLLLAIDLVDLLSSSLALDLFLASMIFVYASGLSAFHSDALRYLSEMGILVPTLLFVTLCTNDKCSALRAGNVGICVCWLHPSIFFCCRHVNNVGPTLRRHSVMSANFLAVGVVYVIGETFC